MPISNSAELVRENDKRIWAIVEHYVEKAYQQSDWTEVERVAIDETSRRKGHAYVTNFVDRDTGRLLFMVQSASMGRTLEPSAPEGRNASSLLKNAPLS